MNKEHNASTTQQATQLRMLDLASNIKAHASVVEAHTEMHAQTNNDFNAKVANNSMATMMRYMQELSTLLIERELSQQREQQKQ